MNVNRPFLSVLLLLVLFAAKPAQAQDWIYQAQPGDTLWDICLEFTAKRGCWLELGKYNDISQARRIQPGTEIRIPLAWLLEVPIVGMVLNVQGEVRYQERDGSNPIPLLEGEQLVLGSIIATGEGTAKIALGDYSEIFIRPNSVLELTSISTGTSPAPVTRLQLDRGDAEVRVTPGTRSRFEVHTPSAIAAVRGTSYRVVNASRESTRSEVLTGSVAVTTETEVTVPAGFGLLAKKGEALGEPKKLLDPPVFPYTQVSGPLPIALAWERDPLAQKWQLDLYGDSGALVSSVQTTANSSTYEELPLGCYRLVARAIDAEGFNGLETALPICVEPAQEPESYLELILWVIFAVGLLI